MALSEQQRRWIDEIAPGHKMTQSTPSLPEIIALLEKAMGPDRELDGMIAALCAPTDDPRAAAMENGRDYPDLYTESIDAAMTLVPEEWSKDIWLRRHNGHHWSCTLHIPSYQQDGRHEQAAIALCIASLNARAHHNEQ